VAGERAQNPACARVTGDRAEVALDFPIVARVGAEIRPRENLRVEGGLVYEGWSRQRELTVRPRGIAIENAVGIPLYEVGSIAVPRNMQDVFSLRFGAEYQPALTLPLVVRAGVILENSAFGSKTLTPLTLDSQKAMLAIGGSVELADELWVDLLYAHMFMKDVNVRDSIVYPQNPLRPAQSNPPPDEPQPALAAPEAVGNGNYALEADLIGLGMRWNL
jgi:long-subunit fatty acid transport protein